MILILWVTIYFNSKQGYQLHCNLNQMDAMIDRWKNVIHSTEELKNSQIEASSLKKERESSKQKQTNHSRQAKKSQTPKKKKRNKQKIIESYTENIIQILGVTITQKNKTKIKSLLEDLWLNASSDDKQNEKNEDLSLKESIVSNGTSKIQQKLYVDLQKRYFECEKQRQYLKGKVDSMIKKYQGMQKQIERYAKIQLMIDNSIQREAQARKEINRLKRDLEVSDLRLAEQQKIFSKEVLVIRQLINSIKANLPNQ